MGRILVLTILALAISNVSMIASAQDNVTPPSIKVPVRAKSAPSKPTVIASTSSPASCLPWFAIFFGVTTTSRNCTCVLSSCSSPLVLGVGF